MRYLLSLGLTVVGLSAIVTPSLALKPYCREGWTVGLAYGPGKAQISSASLNTSDWLEGPAQAIRVGRMFGPSVSIGFEHQAWLREQGVQDLKVRVGTQLEALAVTSYLGRPGSALGGLYVTAGGGYAHCRLTFLEPLAPGESAIGDTHEVVYLNDDFGWGGFAAVGYEFQISRSFAAGLALSYNYLDIGDENFDSAKFVPLMANLNWCF